MIGETHEILEGTYPTIESVQVRFTTTIEQSDSKTFSEQDVLNTISALEQRKIDYCAGVDAEIEVNNAMLLKIRNINRENAITE